MSNKIALSWTRINNFRQCALKFKLEYIDKAENFAFDKDNVPYAMQRGTEIHEELEQYVLAKIKNPNLVLEVSTKKPVEDTKPFVDKLVDSFDKIMPESQISVDENWQQVSWFDKATKFRAIFDLVAMNDDTAVIVDYKTGKFRDYDGTRNKPGQLHLSAAVAFHIWPHITKIHTVYAFVDHKRTIKETFERSDIGWLREKFDHEYVVVNAEEDFEPTPNQYCRFCPATREQCGYANK